MSLPPSIDLSGRVALVTGGIAGIGKGIAIELARRGADVAITYSSLDKLDIAESTVHELRQHRANAKAIFIRADLKEPSSYQQIVTDTLNGLQSDHIDILGTAIWFQIWTVLLTVFQCTMLASCKSDQPQKKIRICLLMSSIRTCEVHTF